MHKVNVSTLKPAMPLYGMESWREEVWLSLILAHKREIWVQGGEPITHEHRTYSIGIKELSHIPHSVVCWRRVVMRSFVALNDLQQPSYTSCLANASWQHRNRQEYFQSNARGSGRENWRKVCSKCTVNLCKRNNLLRLQFVPRIPLIDNCDTCNFRLKLRLPSSVILLDLGCT